MKKIAFCLASFLTWLGEKTGVGTFLIWGFEIDQRYGTNVWYKVSE